MMRSISAAVLVVVLAACAGDSPSGPDGVDGNAAVVARIDSVAVPEATTNIGTGWMIDLRQVWATDRGLYIPLSTIRSGLYETKVLRLTGGVRVGTWQSLQLDEGATAIRPSRLSETDDVFSVYWVGDDHWGLETMNTGTPSFKYVNQGSDINLNLEAIIPDHSSTGRSWGIDIEGRVLRESAFQGGGVDVLRFDTVAEPAGLGGLMIHGVGSPDGTLYWGAADRLHVVSGPGAATSYDLTQYGAGFISRIIQVGDDVWIGYADKVLRLDDSGNLTVVASTVTQSGHGGFCVMGNDLYLSDGTRINLNTNNRQSFMFQEGRDAPTPEQTMSIALATALMSVTMHCHHGSTGNAIYTFGSVGLYQIDPVAAY